MFSKKNLILFLRSLVLQAFWNREGLQNVGFAFLILPYLRARYRADPNALRDAVTAHREYFATNPYVVNMVAALVIDMEDEGKSRREISSLKRYLSASVAALGDSFFWGSLRPLSSVVGSLPFFIWYGGLTPAIAVWSVALYLGVYNGVALTVRFFAGGWAIQYKLEIIQRIQQLHVARVSGLLNMSGIAACAAALFLMLFVDTKDPLSRALGLFFAVGMVGFKLLGLSTARMFFIALGFCIIIAGMGLTH